MHGEGHRRSCPTCGQAVTHVRDVLGNRELRGPRNITSSNLDRIFDDHGCRFLIVEEKQPGEPACSSGQRSLLVSLSKLPMFTVWGARGTPDDLTLFTVEGGLFVPSAKGDFDVYQAAVLDWFADGSESETSG